MDEGVSDHFSRNGGSNTKCGLGLLSAGNGVNPPSN
jgi:hypothetical protein